MPTKIVKFANHGEANAALSGSLIGGRVDRPISGLVGQRLTLTAPAGAHVFANVPGKPPGVLSFEDIKEQLEATFSDLLVLMIEGKLVLGRKTAGQAVSLAARVEPARSLLGFGNTALAGKSYAAPDAAPPRLLGFDVLDSGAIYLLVEE